MLLCGLAIDSGLLYLAKARMGRAVDGAALVAVGNFNRTGTITGGETQVQANRDAVALIMRNFATANFTDLEPIGTNGGPAGGTPSTGTGSNGQPVTTYFYNFNDGTQDSNGAYRRFVQVTLTVGSGGAITSATCNARCPVQTYFIGYATYAIGGRQNVKIGGYSGPTGLADLKVSSAAVATRNPRLIMIVIDRSASMLARSGGASGLPPAVVQFMDFFDTSSDNIGIVSFGTAARLEMPMTTNFIIAGTNNLIDAYETNASGVAEPGLDPEGNPADTSIPSKYDPNYATTGIRRLKFGGSTAADDGIRLAMEQLMANSGFSDPDVVKYLVIFTDGAWNTARTLLAAPGYTNRVTAPTADASHVFVTNQTAAGTPNGGAGAWVTDLTRDTNLVPVPTLSPMPYVTNAIAMTDSVIDYSQIATNHFHDTWLSTDTSGYEPLGPSASSSGSEGEPQLVSTNTWVGSNGSVSYYTHNVDVWLQPGAVAYYYTNASTATPVAYVSDYTNPTKHINLFLASGGHVDLVVPGYIVDGTFYDGLDLNYPDNPAYGESGYPRFRADNFQQAFMWPDDTTPVSTSEPEPAGYTANSLMRQLMFRNYANLLTGFFVNRPDYPLGSGYEPLITDQPPNGAPRARDPLGPYYPTAPFYWPFGGNIDYSGAAGNAGAVTNAVGVTYDPTYSLVNPLSDPDPNYNTGGFGGSRHNAYSINMLATNAAPEWAGELFYKGANGANSTTSSASQIMVSSDWQNGAPDFVAAYENLTDVMTNEPTHDTNITPNPSVWRPLSFNGTAIVSSATPGGSSTGGYVMDGSGNIYTDAMAWSGRPTHYYDFSQGKWIAVANNHKTNIQALTLGDWKAEEYAWHARALGVTIYTVGYGGQVSAQQCAFLAQIANATNSISPGSPSLITNSSPYISTQPIGQQFYATSSADISNDFYSIGQAINAALTQ
jgi:Mg-chelatase subunit ChlD